MACVLYKVVHTCPFITCVCEGGCICGLVCVGSIIFPCLYLYLCLHLCVSKYGVGVCWYSFVCGPVHVCAHVWVLCGVPQLSAKAPGMIPYSYFPFCQFSIIL